MNILILDVETTISNKGHFADRNNRLVMVGLKWLGQPSACYYTLGYDHKNIIQDSINIADLLVGFNIKFDLHWLRNYGIEFSYKKIWDGQLAEFLFESQTNKYPSLNQALEKYRLPSKLDIVKTEYWDKGIDTDQIPTGILREYLAGDLEGTEGVFLKQKELFKGEHKGKYKLFQLQCEDLKVLQEMEYNGIKFNTKAAREESIKLLHKLEELERDIKQTINAPDNVPINLNSNDHLSAILYGGTISWTVKVADGVYKSGIKKGQIRFRNTEVSHEFPRLVEPDPKAETAKSKKLQEKVDWAIATHTETERLTRTYSVSEDVLKNLKARGKAKIIIDKTLEYGIIEKLRGTYLEGYSNLIETMNWPKDMLHGNLNQCTVVTGRLSSTKPNLQNVDPQTKKFMSSRYDT